MGIFQQRAVIFTRPYSSSQKSEHLVAVGKENSQVKMLSSQTFSSHEPLVVLSQALERVSGCLSLGGALSYQDCLSFLFLSIFLSHVIFNPRIEISLLLSGCCCHYILKTTCPQVPICASLYDYI